MTIWRVLPGVILLSGMVLQGTANGEDYPAFQPVKELFDAMSRQDGKAMRETSTKDFQLLEHCLLYTSPSPRDKRQSRMPSSA